MFGASTWRRSIEILGSLFVRQTRQAFFVFASVDQELVVSLVQIVGATLWALLQLQLTAIMWPIISHHLKTTGRERQMSVVFLPAVFLRSIFPIQQARAGSAPLAGSIGCGIVRHAISPFSLMFGQIPDLPCSQGNHSSMRPKDSFLGKFNTLQTTLSGN